MLCSAKSCGTCAADGKCAAQYETKRTIHQLERIADALESMSAEIRSGRFDAVSPRRPE